MKETFMPEAKENLGRKETDAEGSTDSQVIVQN